MTVNWKDLRVVLSILTTKVTKLKFGSTKSTRPQGLSKCLDLDLDLDIKLISSLIGTTLNMRSGQEGRAPS